MAGIDCRATFKFLMGRVREPVRRSLARCRTRFILTCASRHVHWSATLATANLQYILPSCQRWIALHSSLLIKATNSIKQLSGEIFMFLIISKYLKSMEEVTKHYPAHAHFLEEYYRSGRFLSSGRMNPPVGGIIWPAVNRAKKWKIYSGGIHLPSMGALNMRFLNSIQIRRL